MRAGSGHRFLSAASESTPEADESEHIRFVPRLKAPPVTSVVEAIQALRTATKWNETVEIYLRTSTKDPNVSSACPWV